MSEMYRYYLSPSAAGDKVLRVRDSKGGGQMPGTVYVRDIDFLFQCPRWDPEQRKQVHDNIVAGRIDELRYLIAQYFKDKP